MWRTALTFFLSQVVLAQELPTIFQDYLAQNETVTDDDLTYFFKLLEQPLNLNNCSVNELQELPFLSMQQAKSIVNYRADKGKFKSVYELQAIAILNTQTIKRLLPFITLLDNISQSKNMTKHYLRFHIQRFLEKEKEYTNGDYVGNPYKSYLSYSAQSNSMNWGFGTEKDGGERWLDFNSFHFNVEGKNNRLFVGDYQLSLGQGLLCFQGFSFGKSAQVHGAFKNNPVLRSHSSKREYHFLRGLAYQQHYKKWQLSFFSSSNRQDANIIDSTDIVSSVLQSGLHRNESEIADKRQLRQQLIGARLGYAQHNFKTSIYSIAQAYDKRLVLGRDTLSKLWGIGWDYFLTYKNTHFFGEYAVQQNATAFLTAFNAQLAPDLTFSTLYRKYDSDYYSKLSNAFAEQSNVRNERGLYSALSLDLNYNWKLSLYTDIYHFPQASYYSHIPLRGTDYFLQLSYRLTKKLQLYARCNYESKTNNEADDFGLQSVNNTRQLKFVFQWKYNMGDLNLKNRIAWSAVNKGMGYLMSQDLSYKPLEKPFALSLRYVLFDNPSFASRIYAYEPDVMYSFSVPFHYGEGQRLSAVLRYKIKNVTLNAKLAQTLYYDNTDIKSGSVEGNKSTEIKLVLKWVL